MCAVDAIVVQCCRALAHWPNQINIEEQQLLYISDVTKEYQAVSLLCAMSQENSLAGQSV